MAILGLATALEPMNTLHILLSLARQGGDAPANLSFLAYLDTWIIGGLVLLAVAVVAGKWLWGRFRRGDDDGDGYYDDDDYYYDDDR